MTLTVGDVVTLKSGGLKATVVELDPYNSDKIWLNWFYEGNIKCALLPKVALSKSGRKGGLK